MNALEESVEPQRTYIIPTGTDVKIHGEIITYPDGTTIFEPDHWEQTGKITKMAADMMKGNDLIPAFFTVCRVHKHLHLSETS